MSIACRAAENARLRFVLWLLWGLGAVPVATAAKRFLSLTFNTLFFGSLKARVYY